MRLFCLIIGFALLSAGPVAAESVTANDRHPLSACGAVSIEVVKLPPRAAHIAIKTDDSVTIEHLRGIMLDADAPPDVSKPGAPYVAREIQPFRLRHLDVEFHYDGYDPQIGPMYEYVARHGVNRLGAYLRKPADFPQLGDRTTWVLLTSYHWNHWFRERSIPYGHWHRLADAAAAGESLIPEGNFKLQESYELIMMDQEFGGILSPEALRNAPWYPRDADQPTRLAFEDRYYLGYTLAYTEPGQALRAAGWPTTSMYGWKPVERTWLGFGFSWPEGDPYGDRFFQNVYDAYDIHHPDIYCWRWTARNTAWVLWNMDTAVAYARQQPETKPVRPYLSTSILVDPRLRPAVRAQPLPLRDVRAMFAMAFFTGIDGVVQWNWAERWNHHEPPVLESLGSDAYMPRTLMVGSPFSAPLSGRPRRRLPARRRETFERYELLHLLDVDTETGLARFQRLPAQALDADQFPPDIPDNSPIYSLPASELRAHLRPFTETVAAMVEGLAMLKPFEDLIREGTPVIDIPARKQYELELPIIRRIQLGNQHLIATYDPFARTHSNAPRTIELTDFNGIEGRTLQLPADHQLRLFILREETP